MAATHTAATAAAAAALAAAAKAIQMIYRLFLVTAMYCQASSSQFFSITQPLRSFSVLAGWEGSLSTCSR